MDNKNYPLQQEIPISEIEQQVDYARTVCSDLFKLFSPEEADAEFLVNEYGSVRTRLSMMLDFLFQAKLWCESSRCTEYPNLPRGLNVQK